MITQCSWCRRYHIDGRWVDAPYPADEQVTHGICLECEARHFPPACWDSDCPGPDPESWVSDGDGWATTCRCGERLAVRTFTQRGETDGN